MLLRCKSVHAIDGCPLKELHEDFVLSDNHLTQYQFQSFQQASDEMTHLQWIYYGSFPAFHSTEDSALKLPLADTALGVRTSDLQPTEGEP